MAQFLASAATAVIPILLALLSGVLPAARGARRRGRPDAVHPRHPQIYPPENVRLPKDAQHGPAGIRLFATRTDANATRAVHQVRCTA